MTSSSTCTVVCSFAVGRGRGSGDMPVQVSSPEGGS